MTLPDTPPAHEPWWGKGGLEFSCLGCGRCCRGDPGGIFLTLMEELRAARFLQMDLERFRRSCETDRWRFRSLRERSGGACLFLDDRGRCGIYRVRPLACRSWPFWPELLKSSQAWDEAARRCPGMNQGRRWSPRRIEAILAVHRRHSSRLQQDCQVERAGREKALRKEQS